MIGSQPLAPLDDVQRARAGTAVSWGAILAGAAAAVATSVVLVTLGTGLGFAASSPWANHGVSATTFAISGTIWLIVTEWLSAAMGGYLAGRLRHRWLATHPHEIFFRDTAHGLVTWSVATLVVALLAGASLSAVGGGAVRAGAAAAGGMSSGMESPRPPMMMNAGPMDETQYGAEKLLRTMPGTAPSTSGSPGGANDGRMEVMHIAARVFTSGEMSDDDRTYLTSLVAARTGVSQDEAQKRVDAFIAQAKDVQARAKSAADSARKVAAQTAIYAALAMLIGAFIASVSAAIGGRLRDEHL